MTETKKTFSIEESLRFGWGVVEKNFGLVLQFIFATLVVYFAAYLLASVFGRNSMLANVVNGLAGIIVALGWIYAGLKFYDGKKPSLEELQNALSPVFVKYLLASVLYGLAVTIGFILLIVPGVYLAVKYGLFGYLIVDKKMDSMKALEASGKVTDGAKLQLLVFGLLVFVVNMLGAMAFGIGLVVTLPVTLLAGVHVYRKLLDQTKL